ncbi:MAG: ribonuclease H-like domain-containing protein [Desulfobacterales bacterium]
MSTRKNISGMLQNTFCHIPGIGLKTELSLWKSGFTDWQTFLLRCGPAAKVPRKEFIRRAVGNSIRHLEARNTAYFTAALPSHQHWRLFSSFRSKTAYIDIETTGLDFICEITTIALYDGFTIRHYVNGQNLEDFVDDISAYDLLITYNGKCFDIPFLETFFNIRLNQAHIDLRYVLRRLGYSGGLKSCERQLGIDRGELTGIDGFFAVRLWEDYVWRKNEYALETLLRYNIEDVVNLEKLMIMAFNRNLQQTPFTKHLFIAEPDPITIPFTVHEPTVERLMAANRLYGER